MTLREMISAVERELIRKKLIHTNWNQTKASAELEISRTTIAKKIRDYSINRSGI